MSYSTGIGATWEAVSSSEAWTGMSAAQLRARQGELNSAVNAYVAAHCPHLASEIKMPAVVVKAGGSPRARTVGEIPQWLAETYGCVAPQMTTKGFPTWAWWALGGGAVVVLGGAVLARRAKKKRRAKAAA